MMENKKNIWQTLKKPIFTLAPMANVTDIAFRQIIAKYGKPDVLWTEFVSADGLFLGGKDTLMKDLEYKKNEHPIVAQFFSSKPELMEKAAHLGASLGFDGIDINMGCPDRSIEKQGAGASLIKNPTLAIEIIEAAKRGAKGLPVSVKTRLGYNKNELYQWLPKLLSAKPDLITIHARTRKELSKVPANWNYIRKAVSIRDEMKSNTLIFGNGDLKDLKDAREKVQTANADGAMLGKAIFGNPWLFSNSQEFENKDDSKVVKKILAIMVEHTELFEELLPEKNFAIMKKHYKAYTNGFDGAKELRIKLMEAKDSKEVKRVTENFLSTI